MMTEMEIPERTPLLELMYRVACWLGAASLLCGQPLPIEKALDIYSLSDLQFSFEGRKLAFTVTEPVKGPKRASHIWVLETGTGEARQFTSSGAGETRPRWSPDGRRLAFLSSRDGTARIWIMPSDGGEAHPAFVGGHQVEDFAWSPRGTQLAFRAPEPASDSEAPQTVDAAGKLPRLWVVDAAGGKPRPLGTPGWDVGEFVWLDEGRLLVAGAPKRSRLEWNHMLYEARLAGASWQRWGAPSRPFGSLAVSPDRRYLALTGSRRDGPEEHDLFVSPLNKPEWRNLTGTDLDRPVMGPVWQDSQTILLTAAEGFRQSLYRVRTDGRRELFPAPVHVGAHAVSADGTVAFTATSATSLEELWLARRGEAPRQVTSYHKSWRGIRLAAPALFRYRSFDATEIEAALYRPSSPQPPAGYPLVVLVHGGPTGRWADRFEPWVQVLASRGYAVFCPNVRGSTGYGHAFLEANRADWGGGDFKDILAGVDRLVTDRLADGKRLAIAGWSYGGYKAAWAITQTTRFKAAVAGAGISDLASEFGTEDHAAYDRWFFGLPYENLALFQRRSPVTYLKNARTPTLILQGAADDVDPLGQSQQLHRGLQAYGVPTELVIYPREGHSVREEKHRIDLLTRIVAWLDTHMR